MKTLLTLLVILLFASSSLAAELEKAGVFHEMITYSGAPHAFTVFGSGRYRQDADEKYRKRCGDFLEETLR
jgi:dienelactone hydrolase